MLRCLKPLFRPLLLRSAGAKLSCSFHTNRALRATALQTWDDVVTPFLDSDAVKLREYQEECIQSIVSSVDKGERRLAVSLATGGGKTVNWFPD